LSQSNKNGGAWGQLETIISGISVRGEGRSMMDYAERLFPIARSITGDGLRESIKILSGVAELDFHSVPTGYNAFDWTVPREWNIRDAYVKNNEGQRVVDWRKSNLHVVGYSIPVSGQYTLDELIPHIHTLPDQPDAIPYVTSYYEDRWGFCLTHDQLQNIGPGPFEVLIDSTLTPGVLNYADRVLTGESGKEILLSTYLCHPSMANNELSGPIVMAFLNSILEPLDLHYTYRLVLVPETIGSIVYLSKHGDHLREAVEAGYVITCVGDDGPINYKRSRRGTTLADRVAEHVVKQSGGDYAVNIEDFFPGGSDERQYCSPGFDLPVGSVTRSMYGRYPEYHTSLDDLNFISAEGLTKSLVIYLRIIQVLEMARPLVNLSPYGEPQLGKRSLYPTLGTAKGRDVSVDRMMHLLAFADDQHDVVSIADRMSVPAWEFAPELDILRKAELLAFGDED
jgi:aminopeptidase-like protein